MLEQLLKDLSKVKGQSKSSLVKEMVQAAIDENASDEQKLAIIDFANEQNISFLIPSEWFNIKKAVTDIVIDYYPCNEIEDLIEMIMASKIIYVGDGSDMKYFDVSGLNSSTYYEVDSRVHLNHSEDPLMLEILIYIMSLFDKRGVEAPLTEVVVRNEGSEIILSPDDTPTLTSLEKAQRVDPEPRFDNLALPFGDQYLNVRPFLQFAQEKLNPFGALLGALQDGTITINISPEYDLIIQPVLEILGLERISEFILKDGSVVVLCNRISEPSEEDLKIESILNSINF